MGNRLRTVIGLSVVVLAACASRPTSVTFSDGTSGFKVSCEIDPDWSACRSTAEETCHGDTYAIRHYRVTQECVSSRKFGADPVGPPRGTIEFACGEWVGLALPQDVSRVQQCKQ